MAVPRRSGVGIGDGPVTGWGTFRNSYGKQIKDRDGQAAAQVFHPQGAALHALWPAPCRLQEVRHVPHLLQETRRSGLHPGRSQGQLVTAAQKRHQITDG